MRSIRRGISEAIVVIILSMVLIVGIFIAFAIGLHGIAKSRYMEVQNSPVELVSVEFDPSRCLISVALRFSRPIDVQRLTIVLDNNTTAIYNFSSEKTLYGLYTEDIPICRRPVAIVITTVDGESYVLRP